MSLSDLQLNNFKDLFTGNIHNYGQHGYKFSDDGNKEKGTNKTITNKLVTIKEYRDHLEGKTGLGIIPINEYNNCRFAVLDIDVYNQDFSPYIKAIELHNLPIVPFKSKSGGYHLYTFFRQDVNAKQAVDRMKRMARLLGITLFVKQHNNTSVEIFPKQVKLNSTQAGSWINLPYFNADDTKQGLVYKGELLSLNNALTYIKQKLTTIQEIDTMFEELPYNDAPPCLQTIYLLGSLGKNSGRNNYLFSFGVYLKKKDENYFEQALMEVNNSLKDPLDVREIEQTVISSLRRKDYTYKCTVSPCLDFCDKKICKQRTYGIGKEGGYFTTVIFGDLKQYKAASPYYEWEVKGKEDDEFSILRFKNEDEIIKQDAFLRLCFRELHFLPFKMKQTEWFKLVNQALSEIKIIGVNSEDDTSPLVIFHNLFYDFITGRSLATSRDQIRAKRVYYDLRNDRYLFRTKDLIEYLFEFKNFRMYTPSEVHGLIRDMGVRSTSIRTESGHRLRVTTIAKKNVQVGDLLEEQKPFEVDFDEYDEEEQF